MNLYYFDEQGVYAMTIPGDPDAAGLPDNAVAVAPPEEIPAGHAPVVNAGRDGWDLVEDHRGREGWVYGEWTKIRAVGPLPEGWSDEPPEPDLSGLTPAERREGAYMAEADPLFQQAMYYQAEADGLQIIGAPAAAEAAEGKAAEFLADYARKKIEIRERYPDITE
jgi:hypothetical protein